MRRVKKCMIKKCVGTVLCIFGFGIFIGLNLNLWGFVFTIIIIPIGVVLCLKK